MGQASGGLSKTSDRFCLCMLEENYEEKQDSKWICCEGCKAWYHPHCALLSNVEYEEIITKQEKWYCSFHICQEKILKNLEQEQATETNTVNPLSKINILQNEPEKTITNQFLNDRKTCYCGFIAKNERGLKIHANIHKQDDLNSHQLIQHNNNLNTNIPLSNESIQTIFKCIPCNRSFDSSKGLKIHESFHEKLRVKIHPKELVRKRQTFSKKSSSNDITDLVEELADLNDILLLNEESDYQSSNKSSDVPVFPEFLKNRITCDCGFIAKNSLGLKIHQNIHKKKKINVQEQDRVDQHSTSNQQDKTCVDIFGILLSKCKEMIPVVRIIQKSVRSAVSLELSKVIDQVVSKNDENSWFRLLAFPYAVLRLREKKSKGGPNVIRENLKDFEKITNMSEFLSSLLQDSKPREKTLCSSNEQIVKTVNRKLGEGDFSGAMLVLCSNETIAEINDDTLSKLESKHPSDQIPIIDETTPEEFKSF